MREVHSLHLSFPRKRESSFNSNVGICGNVASGFPMKLCYQKLKKFLGKANSGMTTIYGGTHAATA